MDQFFLMDDIREASSLSPTKGPRYGADLDVQYETVATLDWLRSPSLRFVCPSPSA
jgi:hypothetical protein